MAARSFLRGMNSINLFPNEREINIQLPHIKILSDDQAMKADIEQVANDFWGALKIISNDSSATNIFHTDISNTV